MPRSVGHDGRHIIRPGPSAPRDAIAAPPSVAPARPPLPTSLGETLTIRTTATRVWGMRFACPAHPRHALREAAQQIMASRHDLAEERMGAYYARWRPETAAAVLALPTDHVLADYPPGAAIPPWVADMTPGAYLHAGETATAALHARHPQGDTWGIADGGGPWGPTSRRAIRFVVARLADAIARVRHSSLPPLHGILLEDPRPARPSRPVRVFDVRGVEDPFLIAACAVMEKSLVTVAPDGPPVRRDEAAAWPGVMSGLYSMEDALRIFDTYLLP